MSHRDHIEYLTSIPEKYDRFFFIFISFSRLFQLKRDWPISRWGEKGSAHLRQTPPGTPARFWLVSVEGPKFTLAKAVRCSR